MHVKLLRIYAVLIGRTYFVCTYTEGHETISLDKISYTMARIKPYQECVPLEVFLSSCKHIINSLIGPLKTCTPFRIPILSIYLFSCLSFSVIAIILVHCMRKRQLEKRRVLYIFTWRQPPWVTIALYVTISSLRQELIVDMLSIVSMVITFQ